jgi:hypothetical protein
VVAVGNLLQTKLESVEPMATISMRQWLDALDASTMQRFRGECVAGADSVETGPVFDELKALLQKERQPALDKNSALLRQQAVALRDTCMADAKVRLCVCVSACIMSSPFSCAWSSGFWFPIVELLVPCAIALASTLLLAVQYSRSLRRWWAARPRWI